MKSISFIFLSLIYFGCYSQTDTTIKKNDEVYLIVEEMPEFPGGEKGLKEYIKSNIKYPEEAKNNKISGKVWIRFVVNEYGDIEKPTFGRKLTGTGNDSVYYNMLNNEALRVIKEMPKWKPGKQSGKPAKVSFIQPVSFNLDN